MSPPISIMPGAFAVASIFFTNSSISSYALSEAIPFNQYDVQGVSL